MNGWVMNFENHAQKIEEKEEQNLTPLSIYNHLYALKLQAFLLPSNVISMIDF